MLLWSKSEVFRESRAHVVLPDGMTLVAQILGDDAFRSVLAMQGPFPIGHFRLAQGVSFYDWESRTLRRGRFYKVSTSFCDADSDRHDVGEHWKFIGSSFFAFDDLLTLFVVMCDSEYAIPLVWRVGQQAVNERRELTHL